MCVLLLFFLLEVCVVVRFLLFRCACVVVAHPKQRLVTKKAQRNKTNEGGLVELILSCSSSESCGGGRRLAPPPVAAPRPTPPEPLTPPLAGGTKSSESSSLLANFTSPPLLRPVYASSSLCITSLRPLFTSLETKHRVEPTPRPQRIAPTSVPRLSLRASKCRTRPAPTKSAREILANRRGPHTKECHRGNGKTLNEMHWRRAVQAKELEARMHIRSIHERTTHQRTEKMIKQKKRVKTQKKTGR